MSSSPPGPPLPASGPPVAGRRRAGAALAVAAVTLLLPLATSSAATSSAATSSAATSSAATSSAATSSAADADGTVLSDEFDRRVSSGLGTTDSGEAWHLLGDRRLFSVAGGRAQLRLPRAGTGATATADGATGTDTSVRAMVRVDERQTGRGTYASVLGRRVDGQGDYRLKLRFLARGHVLASLVRVQGRVETELAERTVPGGRYTPGRDLAVRLEVAGSPSTALRAKVWRAGTAEPGGWALRATDATRALQRPGAVGLSAYVSSTARNAPEVVSFDHLQAVVGDGDARPDVPDPRPGSDGDRPGPGNTGVPDGLRLRKHPGDLVITRDGARYDGLDVHGFVIVRADDVTITRSRVRGGVARTNIGLITNYVGKRLVVEDTELAPAHPSVWIDGIKGSDYTARRVDVHGTNDNIKVHGDNVRVEASWLHDTVYRLKDPNLGNTPSHNDGVQVLGGRNIRVVGNTITDAHNAALQVTQDYSATTDLRFTGNWVDGGGCSVNLAHKRLSRMGGITVDDNRFGRDTRIRDCAVLGSSRTSFTAHRNVWDDDGTPVRIRRNG